MNLHWGRTPDNKRLMVKIRPRNKPNYSFPHSAYNTSSQEKHYWDNIVEHATNRSLIITNHNSNHTTTFAKNDFLKKSKILSDMKEPFVKSHSFTTVIVISSMFLFFTLSITTAVIVFCRKRNTVFALQKCEQDDEENEYEMDEIHTDVEYTSEYESESTSRRPSSSHHHRPQEVDSPIHQPLMHHPAMPQACSSTYDSELESEYVQHLLPPGDKHSNYASTSSHQGGDSRGAYQRMVVTAVLENQHLQVDTGSGDNISKLREKIHKKYQDFATLTQTDIEDEFAAYPMQSGNLPVISISYADDPPSYDSLSYHEPSEESHTISSSSNNTSYKNIPYVELTEIPMKEQCNTCKNCSVFVTIPETVSPQAVAASSDPSVLFVDLPPKPSHSSPLSSVSSCSSTTLASLPGENRLMYAGGAGAGAGISEGAYGKSPHSMSLPATPLQPTSGQWTASCSSISTALDAAATVGSASASCTGVASGGASWSDLSSHSSSCCEQQPSPVRPHTLIAVGGSGRSRGTRESGIDLLSSSPSSTPLSPPPGFRNDEDYFITPSSTDDSGVMIASV